MVASGEALSPNELGDLAAPRPRRSSEGQPMPFCLVPTGDRLVLTGEVDWFSSAALDAALADQPDPGAGTLDLGRLTFIDSAGLRTLVRYGQRLAAAGGRLTLVNPPALVRSLWPVLGYDSLDSILLEDGVG